MDMTSSTFTITYGEVAENHARMQQIGELATQGISIDELKHTQTKFEALGCICEFINLKDALPEEIRGIQPAAILIIRNAVPHLIGASTDLLFNEHKDLPVDKKALMYGRVVNKHARHNLCFSDLAQEPDYPNGKGRIIPFSSLPYTSMIREKLPQLVGPKAIGLQAEGNYYYDVSKCGIGFHGDGERRIVIACRLGASMPLHYQWFHKNKPVGSRIETVINHGDMYIMSEKAVGTDWKSSSIFTLRHAAGCKKYLDL